MPWCQGPGPSPGRWPEAADDERGLVVGQGDAEEGGSRGVAAEDEVGRGDGSLRDSAASISCCGEVRGEGGVGVPDGGERVAGHAVADVDVALAGAVQGEFGGQRSQPSVVGSRELGLPLFNQRQEVVGRVRATPTLGNRRFPARRAPVAEIGLIVAVDDLDVSPSAAGRSSLPADQAKTAT